MGIGIPYFARVLLFIVGFQCNENREHSFDRMNAAHAMFIYKTVKTLLVCDMSNAIISIIIILVHYNSLLLLIIIIN